MIYVCSDPRSHFRTGGLVKGGPNDLKACAVLANFVRKHTVLVDHARRSFTSSINTTLIVLTSTHSFINTHCPYINVPILSPPTVTRSKQCPVSSAYAPLESMAKDAESEMTSSIAVLPTHAYYLTFVAVDHTWSDLTRSQTDVSIRGTDYLHKKRIEDIVLPLQSLAPGIPLLSLARSGFLADFL